MRPIDKMETALRIAIEEQAIKRCPDLESHRETLNSLIENTLKNFRANKFSHKEHVLWRALEMMSYW